MKIRNVCIYVSDSLRWDYLPSEIADQGIPFKTVAQSCYSAPSFSTLSTGLYPQRHGVSRWYDRIPTGVPTIYDIPNTNGGYYQPGSPDNEAMFSVLDREEATALSSSEPPFIYMERDAQPHVPFGGSGCNSVEEYFRSRKSDWDRITREYQDGIEGSMELFQRRLDQLSERGILDSTLVILTSDHGELFGEYGEAAHTAPATPELAYVPTVFMHPSLSAADFTVDASSDIIEHVDVITTALAAAGLNDAIQTDGVDLLSEERPRDWGYNHVTLTARQRDFYVADSIWWPDSRYAFHRNSLAMRLLTVLYRFTRSSERHALRWNVMELLEAYAPSTKRFGDPPVSAREAMDDVERLLTQLGSTRADSGELDEEAVERLKELGYLDT